MRFNTANFFLQPTALKSANEKNVCGLSNAAAADVGLETEDGNSFLTDESDNVLTTE